MENIMVLRRKRKWRERRKRREREVKGCEERLKGGDENDGERKE